MAIVSLYTPKSSPHRSELFSSGQMKKHGNVLAVLHQLTKEHRSQLLLTRLTNNEKVLISSHTLLTAAVKAKRMITRRASLSARSTLRSLEPAVRQQSGSRSS